MHEVSVDGFWMDRSHDNERAVLAFRRATGYVTSAERRAESRRLSWSTGRQSCSGFISLQEDAEGLLICKITRTGGLGCPERVGNTRSGRRVRLKGSSSTLSSTLPTRMPKPMRAGRRKNCLRKQNGSEQREAVWTARNSHGAMSIFPMENRWPTAGRASSPGKIRCSTASRELLPWAPSRPMGTDYQIWRVMFGNGHQIGTSTATRTKSSNHAADLP